MYRFKETVKVKASANGLVASSKMVCAAEPG